MLPFNHRLIWSISGSQTGYGFDLTFPHDRDFPTRLFECCIHSVIALNVVQYLFAPKVSPSFWKARLCATLMTVPKAAVNRDENCIARCQRRLRIQPKSDANNYYPCWCFDIGGNQSSYPAVAG